MAVILRAKEWIEHDEEGGYAASVLYHAFNDDGSPLTVSAVRSALPLLGSSISIGTATAYLRSRRISPIRRSSKRAWSAQLEYGPAQADEDFTATGSRVDAIAVDTYRTNASLPGSIDNPATTDIGGTRIDTGGDPVSHLVPRQELRVTNYLSSVPYDTYAAVVGKRNSATFLGKPAGYLLYRGTTDTRVGLNRYEVTHEFVYDGLAHLRQKPKLDQDRQPIIELDGGGIPRAKHVFWVQPFPNTADFSTLGIVL